jgi:hypothetical protein
LTNYTSRTIIGEEELFSKTDAAGEKEDDENVREEGAIIESEDKVIEGEETSEEDVDGGIYEAGTADEKKLNRVE